MLKFDEVKTNYLVIEEPLAFFFNSSGFSPEKHKKMLHLWNCTLSKLI